MATCTTRGTAMVGGRFQGKTLFAARRFQGKTLFAARRFQGKTLFAAAVFVASVLALALKLLDPTPVQILVEGNTAITAQVPGLFTYADVFVIAVALVLMSVSGTYILLQDSTTPAAAAPRACVRRGYYPRRTAAAVGRGCQNA